MAHLHLATRAIARRDSATAINEARIAAQIRPTDPLAQFLLGYSLLDAGHPADAIDALRAAVADDPYFACPTFTWRRRAKRYTTPSDLVRAIADSWRTPLSRTPCARPPRVPFRAWAERRSPEESACDRWLLACCVSQ
jgi:tetratricopeptide (TPR) repeat protein